MGHDLAGINCRWERVLDNFSDTGNISNSISIVRFGGCGFAFGEIGNTRDTYHLRSSAGQTNIIPF
jgi:hypothetical protein